MFLLDTIDWHWTWLNSAEKSFVGVLPKIVLGVLVLVGFWFLARLIKNYTLKVYSRRATTTGNVAQAVASVLYAIAFVSGILLSLQVMGLEGYLTKMLAGAGIVGIVAGFALKDIASNLFAGMLVNMQKPFQKKDWVSLNGEYGQVNEVGWIATSVTNISGQQVFVPNQLIYSNVFVNYSTFKRRRVILQTGVSYGDDLELVQKAALDEVSKMSVVLKDQPIDFYFTEIGGYSYNFEIRFWISFNLQIDYLNAMSEAIIRIKKRFEQEGFSIAYPVQTLDFGVKGGVNIYDKPLVIRNDSSTESK